MNTKETILTAAQDLFSRSGYEAVGIQQICTAAGITKPSLYYHFGNKETLLAAVARDATSAFITALAAAPSPSDPGTEEEIRYSGDLVSDVRALFVAVLWFSREQAARFQIILQMLYPPQGGVFGQVGTPQLQRIHSALVQFFTAAAGGHGNLIGKEQFLATVFLGHAIALSMFVTEEHPGVTADSPTVVLAAQTFLYGIF
ncbi:MAG: TetR/AcrR family transcriptional regulator [Alkalispirochaeta sp.]